MAARTTAWLVWALLAGSVVFWGLRLGVPPQGLPTQVQTVGADQSTRGEILRLFANPSDLGAAAPAQQGAASSRLKLFGVVAGSGEGGWAMLSVDGLPTRMVSVGGKVVDDWVVQSVSQRQVAIGPAGGAPVALLDLPMPAAPRTGTLNPPTAGQAAAVTGAPPAAVVNANGMGAAGGIAPPPPPVVLGNDGNVVAPAGEPQASVR